MISKWITVTGTFVALSFVAGAYVGWKTTLKSLDAVAARLRKTQL